MENKWYSYIHEGGAFPVCFRPFGVFQAPDFPTASSYAYGPSADGATMQLNIEFGKFGQYSFASSDASLATFTGSLVNTPEKWRRLEFLRDFTDAESLMYSGGTIWSFEWAKGTFEVEFRADAFNHFICPTFPSHSHWKMDGNTNAIYINFDKYGEYDMVLDMATASMTGAKRGQPDNWRKAKFIRSLGVEGVNSIALDHGHSHDH